MKKSIRIILLIIIIILIAYIIYINNYKISNKDQKRINKLSDNILIKEMITITKKESDNYYEFKNVKFNNSLEEFECIQDDKLICKNNNIEFSIIIENDLVTKYKNYKIKGISGEKILKKNKIKDDINLLGLIKETKNFKPYFKPINEIKETYSLETFALQYINNFNYIDLINTPYPGYILNSSNTKEYIYTLDNTNYIFKFKNLNYFTKAKRNEIISTIVIE